MHVHVVILVASDHGCLAFRSRGISVTMFVLAYVLLYMHMYCCACACRIESLYCGVSFPAWQLREIFVDLACLVQQVWHGC